MSDADTRDADTNEYRLEVTAGPQRGARARVSPGTTLGSGLDNDVVLVDPRVAPRALAFEADERGALALAVDGCTLHRDGVALEGDGPHVHEPGASYRLGATEFTLRSDADGVLSAAPGSGRDGTTQDGGAPASGVRLAKSAEAPAARETAALADEARANQVKAIRVEEGSGTWLPKVLFGVAALVAIAIGVSYALHRPSAPEPVEARASAPAGALDAAARRLSEAGFDHLDVVDGGAGVGPRVSGYVANRQRLQEVKRTLADLQPPPALEVHVQSDIVEGVRDVYRTNGVKASVESAGEGAVRVVTFESEPLDTAFMKTAAKEDVAGLSGLESRNEPPPVAPPPVAKASSSAPREVEPGKRVVAIIEGDPSYVLTEDDSRYFVGSALPTGHTIADIRDEAVTLELSGRRTRLEF